MKTLIYVGLTSVILVLVIACLNLVGQNNHSSTAQTQISPIATPCPSPAMPSNMVTPCNPIQTPIEEDKNKRQSNWEVTKKRLLTAKFPLKNENFIDVDGDGKKDKVFYQIKPWQEDFEGLLKITSAQNKVVWEQEFFMSSNDLAKFLVEVLEYDSVTEWVKNVFNKGNDYVFESSQEKIKKSEIDNSQIDFASKLNKTTAQKLKSEILGQKINHIYTYRAEWREDLMQIVYVPSLKKFVCYSRGY